ncbi:MAG: NeuD/PglB/VioB family sugar acetyltransferase [Ignavibacteria bacterium]
MIREEKVILIGGFHEVVELCERCNKNIIGIIDKEKSGSYMGYKIFGTDECAENIFKEHSGVPLIFSPDLPEVKSRLSKYYENIGFKFTNLISPKANLSKHYEVGKGIVVQDGANISSNVKLGNFIKLNINANVMHDTSIGDFTTIAPNSVILGRVELGKLCYVGANSTILPGLIIGNESIVGAGSVVTKNIENNKIVSGNPAKVKGS